MRRWLFVLVAGSLMASFAGVAAQKMVNLEKPKEVQKGQGSLALADKRLASLDNDGPTELKNVVVFDTARVTGPFQAESSVFGRLMIQGPARMRECVVTDKSWVEGTFESYKVIFFAPLTIKGERAVLSSSILDSVRVKGQKGVEADLYLIDGTIIKGDVEFEGAAGNVFMSDDVVLLGKIRNGRARPYTKTSSK